MGELDLRNYKPKTQSFYADTFYTYPPFPLRVEIPSLLHFHCEPYLYLPSHRIYEPRSPFIH